MRNTPWLIVGMVVGMVVASVVGPPSMWGSYNHGTEEEMMAEIMCPAYGAAVGLLAGLGIDLYLRRRPPDSK